jgi:hypothetical protein
MNPADGSAKRRQEIREELRKSIDNLNEGLAEDLKGIYPADRYDHEVKVGRLRRAGRTTAPDPTRSLTLLEDENGVLLWEEGAVLARPVPGGLRRGFRGVGARGDVVEHVVVEPLEPSQVSQMLAYFDGKLTPKQGLREFANGALQPPSDDLKPVSKGRILLIVHGTFSESQAIFSQLKDPKNKAGELLLETAAVHYNQILAFDHPTMSVSPMLNAVDLARRLRDTKADIDVICHSRGGLVTRWWLESFDRPAGKRRVVLVGCPLEGTSLAAPPRLRSVLSWLSNLNKFIAKGTSMIPFMTVVACLARLTATVTSLAAKTPVIDAAVAMIPGLSAMSRIENNFELGRLNKVRPDSSSYFVIKSRFQPSDPGWKFWEYFVDQPLQRAAYSLFPGANDLVVDTDSMTVLEAIGTAAGRKVVDIAPAQVHDFGATSSIYHTNYFSQPKTAEKITEWLKIGGA